MKKTLDIYFIIILFFIVNSAISQTVTTDSINKVLDSTFKLLQQGKIGDAMRLNDWALDQSIIKKDTLLISCCYNHIGISEWSTKNYSKAIVHYKKALKGFYDTNATSRIVGTHSNIALCLQTIKKYEEAKEEYLKALKKTKTNKQKSLVYSNLGYLSKDTKNYNEAIKYINKALEINTYSNNLFGLALNHYNLYDSYLLSNDTINAKSHFNKSYKIANEENYNLIKYYLYKSKYQYLSKHKITKNVFTVVDTILSLKDKIKEDEGLEIYKEIETKYNIKSSQEKLELIEKKQIFQKAFIVVLLSSIAILGLFFGLIYKKNKALKKAKEKADILAKAKANFYSEISHEIRTPLYAIIELSKILIKENPKNQNKQYLDSLFFSSNYLLILINNVLEFNKIDAKKSAIQEHSFNLKKLIDNIVLSLNFLIKQQNNDLKLNYDGAIPELIIGDSLKLSQIIINLLSNAIKFTKNGLITITIKQEEKTEEETILFFEIKDTGEGISKEKQELIYQEYYQDIQVVQSNQASTGLGLSIVLKLLKILNSKIALNSKLGFGSSFSFKLKFKINENNNLKIEEEKTLKGFKLLVVDDNAINLMVTKKIIEGKQGECKVLNNGIEAISVLEKESFDCVLMDVNMPTLNGLETSEKIKAFNKNIPIILLTALNQDKLDELIKTSHVDDYIIKPYKNTVFLNTIHRVLEKKFKQ